MFPWVDTVENSKIGRKEMVIYYMCIVRRDHPLQIDLRDSIAD